MSDLTAQQLIKAAVKCHQAGQLIEAENLYRQVLAQDPDQPDASHLLGVICHQAGRHDLAVDFIRKAIAVKPAVPDYYSNLGLALAALKQTDEAIKSYRKAVSLKSDYAQAHTNLGIALLETNRIDEALEEFRLSLKFGPARAEAYNNLGNALRLKREYEQSIEALTKALELRPQYPEALNNLGLALLEFDKPDEAVLCLHQAVALKPAYAEAQFNLGNAFRGNRQYEESIVYYQQALQVRPNYPAALVNLGLAYLEVGKVDDTIACYRQSMELGGESAQTYELLANAMKERGEIDQALAYFHRALEIDPQSSGTHSSLNFSIHLHPDFDAAAIFKEHRRWNQKFVHPLRHAIQPHDNDRSPSRRLRIGYVSPDFVDHVAGWHFIPLLKNHNAANVETFCYASIGKPDWVTDLLRASAHNWRPLGKLDDSKAAALIRKDKIDILVDLTLHSGANRLTLFARKPAPVQLTWLAYCSTSGMDAIDYRLSDPYMDPPDSDLSCYSEQTIRMPRTFWTYHPYPDAPEIGPVPAKANGHVTFGSLNSTIKVNAGVLDLWAQLLLAVPRSRLLLSSRVGVHQQFVIDRMTSHGIPADRIEFVTRLRRNAYMETFNRIDIALDPFPYGGGITTCDTLWMGVPVITLSGRTAVGRGATSVLSNAGLSELVTKTPADYIKTARDLSDDVSRLIDYRSTLRHKMQNCPLLDAPRFAQDIEAIYRHVWRRWTQRG